MLRMIVLSLCFASSALAQVGLAPAATVRPEPWRKISVDSAYRAEGANVGDFDKDGKLDLVFGAFWYRGPDFKTKTRIHPGGPFPIGLYADRFFAFVDDIDRDGWPDVLAVGFPGQNTYWYRNPGRSTGLWRESLVAPAVGLESPAYEDLDGDGVRELVCAIGGLLVRCVPDRAKPFAQWKPRLLSTTSGWTNFTHGFGIGDVNGDGRKDLLTRLGWFEQPKSLVGDPAWIPHPFLFSSHGGAQMHVTDLDGDGDNDVVSSLNAHGWGLAWYEHVKVGTTISFRAHQILPPFPPPATLPRVSQLHAVVVRDFDGDGLPDIATGKTFWAHLGNDPGARDPAELWVFLLRRGASGVRFEAQLVDDNSGTGRQLVAHDVNGDGKLDLVVGNKKGASIHIAQE